MNAHARHLAVFLSPLILLAACSSGQQNTVRLLDDRLQYQLAPDIAAGNVALQSLPDGAQVTLLGASWFPNGVQALDHQRPDIRDGVIEALLDPALMRIQVTDTSALPDDQRDARVRNVVQYFEANGLGATLVPAAPQAAPVGAAPAGLAITINVECPDRHDGTGYGSGRSKPACF